VRLLRPSPRAAPALQCDAPFGEGRRFVHNELAVRGSAGSPAGIAEVRVEIGSTRQTASISGSDGTRFESVIDTSAWRPGTAVLTVTALDRAGREAVESGDVRVEPYAMPARGRDAVAGTGTALHCRPLGRTATHLPVKIRGWAYSRSGIERVSVFLDGRSCHEALYGLTRPHLEKALATPDALECGYYVLLDPYVCEPGEHVLTVVATPREGPPVGLSRSFVCADDAGAARGEVEPSVPAEPSPRPKSVPIHARTSRQLPGATEPAARAAEARYRWVAQLAAGRTVLDADHETEDLSGPLPFESDSFDLVICFEALEEVDDPDAALAELSRVLRPGGLLVASWRPPAELGPSLQGRFENVRAYRQQECAAALIVSEDESADTGVEVGFAQDAAAVPEGEAVTIAVASDAPIPALAGLALVGGRDVPAELRETAAGWRERALLAEAEAAANLTERAQAQRGEERAFMFLRAAEERRREAERALERRPIRRLRRYLSRMRGSS
jgi:SAM-dependent methyltransferase